LLLVEPGVLGDGGEHVERADVLALLEVRHEEAFDHRGLLAQAVGVGEQPVGVDRVVDGAVAHKVDPDLLTYGRGTLQSSWRARHDTHDTTHT
jgi:hypothetical protein